MANPLVIEQNFQTLKQTLRLISSSRLRILRIVEFIDHLLDSPTFFPAYAPELLPQLVESINKTDFTGTNLSCLERCIKLLERIENNQPSVTGNSEFKQAQQHLKAESDKIQSWIKSKNIEGPEGFSRKKFDVGSVWIPMVEREQFLTAVNPLFASLQKLNIEAIFSKKEADADKLHIKQLSHKEETEENELINTVEAARHLLGKFAHIKNGKRVTINCTFDNPTYVEGQSLQAGLAAGLFTELLHLHQHKEEYTLQDDVAITGRVDKKANLLPVDEDGLKLKVEACYFSHIKYLIVPKEQAELCKTHISYLTSHSSPLASHNEGISTSLEVIGISNLEELFYNRKFTDSRRITVARQTARKVWKLRRPIAVVLIVSLLLIIGKMWYGPLDKNPTNPEFEGEMLILKNQSGEVVDKILVGKGTVKRVNDTEREGKRDNFAILLDVNNDNTNEVIWTQFTPENPEYSSTLFCKSVNSDTCLWSFNVNRKVVFPQDPEVSSTTFSITNIMGGDFDNDRRPEIYLNCRHSMLYPDLVIKLDAQTKKELSCYVNTGHFIDMTVYDINGDGVRELLLCGMNNAYDQAVLTVLDPRFIGGDSPAIGEYVIQDYTPAKEMAYMLLPRSVLSLYFEATHNCALNINIDEGMGLFDVNVRDFFHPENKDTPVSLFFYFDYGLKFIHPASDNNYDHYYRKLTKGKKIPEIDQNTYLQELGKQIQYWDGDKFVNYPTLNKRYLEAVAELEPEK